MSTDDAHDPQPVGGKEVPPDWRSERPWPVVVDGQKFLVRPRPAEPGTYNFDWTTGPKAGYGFSISGGGPLIHAEIEENIRGFLSGINPETGYLD